MRLSRQAVVEVRKSSNWVPRAPRGYCYKRVLHACIGSRMQPNEELVEEQRQDRASLESCDAVVPPVPVPYGALTVVDATLHLQLYAPIVGVF